MLTNNFNLLEDYELEADNDNSNGYDDNKFILIEQACKDNDLDYIKKHIRLLKLNKNRKKKYLINLFDISCSYKSFNTIEYLINQCDKKKISEYIVNNVKFYFSETNEDILEFFIKYDLDLDLDLDNNQSIFSLLNIIEIFTHLCKFGMDKLVKLMYNNYQPIKDTFGSQYYNYIRQIISNGKFNILEYLCELIDDYNSNVVPYNKIIIHSYDMNIGSCLNVYFNSLISNKNNFDNKILYEIYSQFEKKQIFDKFNFLTAELLNSLNNNLLYDEYKIILGNNFHKILGTEKNLSENHQFIVKMLFEGFNMEHLEFEEKKKLNVNITCERNNLFIWMIELINNNYTIDITEYIIYFLGQNRHQFDYSNSNTFIMLLIQKYNINKNKQNYIKLFMFFLDIEV
jgi:hypothetical protein